MLLSLRMSKSKLIKLITNRRVLKPPPKKKIKEIREYLEKSKWQPPPEDLNISGPFDSSKAGFKEEAKTVMVLLDVLGLRSG